MLALKEVPEKKVPDDSRMAVVGNIFCRSKEEIAKNQPLITLLSNTTIENAESELTYVRDELTLRIDEMRGSLSKEEKDVLEKERVKTQEALRYIFFLTCLANLFMWGILTIKMFFGTQ